MSQNPEPHAGDENRSHSSCSSFNSPFNFPPSCPPLCLSYFLSVAKRNLGRAQRPVIPQQLIAVCILSAATSRGI